MTSLLALVLSGALVAALEAPPAQAATVFSDGFENAATVQDLLAGDRWSYIQQENRGTEIDLSTSPVHSGSQSIRFFGHRPGRVLTKSDIAKSGIVFLTGQTLEVEAWFYFEDVADPNNITLIDTECGSCNGAGARVFVVDGFPQIERGELGPYGTFRQRYVRAPMQQWFSLRYRLRLGQGPQGHAWLWINGTKVIDRAGTTSLPGGLVDNTQVGLTANASTADAELFVDDVTIRRIDR